MRTILRMAALIALLPSTGMGCAFYHVLTDPDWVQYGSVGPPTWPADPEERENLIRAWEAEILLDVPKAE